MCCARLHATFPHRKDVAFIKAKHGKGAVQNSRHTHSGGAQRAASLWKQVLLTLLIFIALLALIDLFAAETASILAVAEYLL